MKSLIKTIYKIVPGLGLVFVSDTRIYHPEEVTLGEGSYRHLYTHPTSEKDFLSEEARKYLSMRT